MPPLFAVNDDSPSHVFSIDTDGNYEGDISKAIEVSEKRRLRDSGRTVLQLKLLKGLIQRIERLEAEK